MMIDYSNQEPNQRKGKHSSTLNEEEFVRFALSVIFLDVDIMLEIKDKERSAKRAIKLLDHIKTR
jgi:UV DNA damage endonuclease